MALSSELQELVEQRVPEEALRFFARWWQLESYLRELAYTELRSMYGRGYVEQLPKAVERAQRDEVNAYMASADYEDLFSYLDAGALLRLIDQHWELFSETLLPRERWAASSGLVRELRNRVSHCRRPHADDLGRILQLLRDLERGAQRFYASYSATDCEPSGRDPMVRAWIKGKHEDAHLIAHAERSYWTRLRLGLSRRPWAEEPRGKVVSGRPGYLWHASWVMEGREVRPSALWERIHEQPEVEQSIVHLLMPNPYDVTATFATIDDPSAAAEALGRVFAAMLEESREIPGDSYEDAEAPWEAWRAEAAALPRKVQAGSVLALFDAYNPNEVFGAQDS